VASTLAMTLCEPVSTPGVGAIAVNDPALIAELADAAELAGSSCIERLRTCRSVRPAIGQEPNSMIDRRRVVRPGEHERSPGS
jgi:hypothetical protein